MFSLRIKEFCKSSAEKDSQFILNFNFSKWNLAMMASTIAYGCLNILDVYSTFLVLNNVPFSYETNPFVREMLTNGNSLLLMSSKVSFFLAIVVVDFLPIGRWGKMEIHMRTLKLGTLIGLLIVVPLMLVIVSHNFLIFFYFS